MPRTSKKKAAPKKPRNVKLACRNNDCGKEITVKASEKDDYSFCAKCGGPLLEMRDGGFQIKCTCGHTVKVKKTQTNDVKFCSKCGQPLFDDVAPQPSQQRQEVQVTVRDAPPQKPRLKIKKQDMPENPGFPAKFFKKLRMPEFTDEIESWMAMCDFIFGRGRWNSQKHAVSAINEAVQAATKEKAFTLERVIAHLTGGEQAPGAQVQSRANDTGQLAIPPEKRQQGPVFGWHDPKYGRSIMVR